MPTTIAYNETYADALNRRFVEEGKQSQRTIEREEWVRDRTSQIYLSKHYRLDLVAYVLEGKTADKVFDSLFNATSADYIEALSGFHSALMAEARKLAESEADRRFNYIWN